MISSSRTMPETGREHPTSRLAGYAALIERYGVEVIPTGTCRGWQPGASIASTPVPASSRRSSPLATGPANARGSARVRAQARRDEPRDPGHALPGSPRRTTCWPTYGPGPPASTPPAVVPLRVPDGQEAPAGRPETGELRRRAGSRTRTTRSSRPGEHAASESTTICWGTVGSVPRSAAPTSCGTSRRPICRRAAGSPPVTPRRY